MDGRSFDSMTRALADGRSRRAVLRALAAGTLGLLLGGTGTTATSDAAAATCGQVGATCDPRHRCCGDAVCANGRCRCPRGYTNCRGTCQNLRLSEEHCGKCFHGCARDEFCRMGTCCLMPNGTDPLGD